MQGTVRLPQRLGVHSARMARGLQANRVVCMAHPRRVAKVAKQIEREIGNMFLFDRRLQEAVCPERRYGVDNAVSGLASVTEVVLSGDLQVAKVYISVFSDDFGKAVALSNLKKLEGYVRYNIGQQMRLRLVPEIRFIEDESLEKSLQVLKLLDQIKAEREGGPAMPRPPVAIKGERDFEEDEDEDEDEDDEGIVDISTSADEDIEAAFADMERTVGVNSPSTSARGSRGAPDTAKPFRKARVFRNLPSLNPKSQQQNLGPEGYMEGKYGTELIEELEGRPGLGGKSPFDDSEMGGGRAPVRKRR